MDNKGEKRSTDRRQKLFISWLRRSISRIKERK